MPPPIDEVADVAAEEPADAEATLDVEGKENPGSTGLVCEMPACDTGIGASIAAGGSFSIAAA